nr:GNAT family N-acetyltransferase [Clostridioides difficile]
MEIRKAVIDDVEDISEIYAQSWKTAYKGIIPQDYLDNLKNDFWVETFKDLIENNKITAKMVFDNKKSIGCIAYGNSRDDTLKDWGEIVSLYLLPQYFGKGVGNEIFQSAIDDMKLAGFSNIYLWVLEENQRARKFYEKHGFYCNNDIYTVKIMDKKINDIRYIYTFK